MQGATKDKLSDLQHIIARMPLDVFCVTALPEFGVRWRELAKAVRNARLPMQPASVARVLCKHVSKALTADELDDIVARLRLKLVATQARTWHVIRLSEKTIDEPVTMSMNAIPGRIAQVLRKNKRSMRPEIQTVFLGDLMYLSIQLVSDQKEGSTLYVATPLGEPVALVSSVNAVGLLKAAVEGLGYKTYENANLYGRDVKSLLRINNRSWNANAEHLAAIPEYAPVPVITENGIDYTNKTYDENYVDAILGPDPPVITDLNIETTKDFFDKSRLNKTIKLTVNLKTENLAKTLKSWVAKGAIAPTSDLIQIFHQIKSNKINYSRPESDED
ncbi:hypothetical protein PYW08_016071 [Mythimna loreyi]|uniref:Uncharacterized protein n=1 Tax=Mythimna loreyi TaxID=667449 RepID=A0ACC2QSE4_9NEOP|nr:hypothetical protein PYW08_016071 [Mythimna loreyi]